MMDRIYYDRGGYNSWTAMLWSEDGRRPEVPDVNIPQEILAKLDERMVYECETEERGDELWVVEVGDIFAGPPEPENSAK